MRRYLASACFLALFASPLVGRAEPASADIEVARGAFKQAERAFAEAKYEDALSLFRLALTKAPNDAVRFNVAVCLERLGRRAEARYEYEAAASSASLGDQQRDAARQRAQALALQTSELILVGVAAGSQISVDGAPVCTAPCRIFVEPGDRAVTVKSAEGPLKVTVTAEAGVAQALKLNPPQPEPSLPPEKASAPAPREATPPPPPAPTARSSAIRPGWLSVAGGITAGVGAAGVLGFGLRTRSLESSYHAAPAVDVREDGLRMQALTNVSIAVAGVGAALVVIDLLVLSTGKEPSDRRARGDQLRWVF